MAAYIVAVDDSHQKNSIIKLSSKFELICADKTSDLNAAIKLVYYLPCKVKYRNKNRNILDEQSTNHISLKAKQT